MMNFEEMKELSRKNYNDSLLEALTWWALSDLFEILEDFDDIDEEVLEQQLERIWRCANPLSRDDLLHEIEAEEMSEDGYFEHHWDDYWDCYDPNKEL